MIKVSTEAEVSSGVSTGEECASKLTHVVVGRIQLLEVYQTEGFISFLAVAQRPPPFLVMWASPTCQLASSKPAGQSANKMEITIFF